MRARARERESGVFCVVLLFFNASERAPKGNERANASRHPEPANFYSYFMAINFFGAGVQGRERERRRCASSRFRGLSLHLVRECLEERERERASLWASSFF